MKERRPGTLRPRKPARSVTPVTREDADREWLLAAFAFLARGASDVDALVEFRTRARMRPAGMGRLAAPIERRRSAGRRLADLARAFDPFPES